MKSVSDADSCVVIVHDRLWTHLSTCVQQG